MKKIMMSWLVVMLVTLSGYAQTVELLSLGTEEAIGNNGRLSTVAVDAFDQPHIACDGGSFIYFYDKNNNAWKYSELNMSPLGYRQYYNPHMEIDSGDRCWISGILVSGLGLIVREGMSTNPSIPYFSDQKIQGGNTWDSGNLSIDPAFPLDCVLMSARGKWKRVTYSATSPTKVVDAGNGEMYAGADGEKKGFWISKAGSVQHKDGSVKGVWHLPIGGYSEPWPSQYQNSFRAAQGIPRVTWAAFANYQTMGDDGCYVDCVSDSLNPQLAYMISDFSVVRYGGTAGVAMNIWNGSVMLFDPNAILSVDKSGTSGLRRFAPQLAPSKNGGAFITWTRAGRIKLRYVSQTGILGTEWDVAVGSMSSLCTDSQGNIHLVYKNGGMKYRKVLVSSSVNWNTPPVDMNGDKTNEVAYYDPLSTYWVSTTLNDSNVSVNIFGSSNSVPVPGDYNNDGRTEVGVFDVMSSTWNLVLDSNTNNVHEHYVQWGYSGCNPVPGDYDGDGYDDLCVYDNAGNWYVMSLVKGWIGNNSGFGSSVTKPVPGDYDGDGDSDLATFDLTSGKWLIRELDTYVKQNYAFGVSNAISFVGKYSSTNNFVNYLNGIWNIDGVSNKLNWGYAGALPIIGDYNGDGTNDPTVFDKGTWYSRTVEGTVIHWGTKFGISGDVAVNGDYDGDKKTDLTTFNSGKWVIKSSKTGMITTNNWGFKGGLAMSGDFDGDGISDICVVDTNKYYWYVYSIAKTNVIAWSTAWGYKGTTASVADYDKDGKDDLVIFDPAGKWYIHSIEKNSVLLYGYTFGAYKGFIANKSELVSYNPSSLQWNIKHVGDIIADVNWGYAGCQPISGDFDGDGVSDLNCVDMKTYKWYSFSIKKGTLINGKQWGGSGMIVASGDYDGDQVTDMATFDKIAGGWYIFSIKKNAALAWNYKFGSSGVIPMGSMSK